MTAAIISSAAYVNGEFVSEVGALPPSMLPIGAMRLWKHQVMELRRHVEDVSIFLTLPDTYVVGKHDREHLEGSGVQIIWLPEGLCLGESIFLAVNVIKKEHSSSFLLYGDTLVRDAQLESTDFISVHPSLGLYNRAFITRQTNSLKLDSGSNDGDRLDVVSGYFRFSNLQLLVDVIRERDFDFLMAIERYSELVDLKLENSGIWLDCGHINTYFKARANIFSTRSFNDIKFDDGTVVKSSKTSPNKIFAEGLWYESLPVPLRRYTPPLLKFDKGGTNFDGASYSLHYLNLLSLNDLYTFCLVGTETWGKVFASIRQLLSKFLAEFHSVSKVNAPVLNNRIYLEKTRHRLFEFSKKNNYDLSIRTRFVRSRDSLTLLEAAAEAASYIRPATHSDLSIIHGDLCFSNILFDFRDEAVKVIDPRGIDCDENFTIFGDIRYDIAKLYHSIYGFYDFIIAGHYDLVTGADGVCSISFGGAEVERLEVVDNFRREILGYFPYDEKEILAITVLLFLSMLPLHADRPDRQAAFIANAFRLFKELKELPQ